ncbi:MAG: TetR/AcrR family transcriptional regulator [Treponemataceae bacterium]
MPLSDRQREIIDAALELINDQGIQELTMKRIAAAVGVSEPALYRHFPSKSEILSAVVDEMEAARSGAMSAGKTAGQSAESVLLTFFEAHATQFQSRPELTTILFSEDVFRNDAKLLSRVVAIISGTQALLRAEIEKGKLSGFFRQDADTENAALMLAGGFRLLVSTWRLGDYPFNLSERTASFVKSVLALLKK